MFRIFTFFFNNTGFQTLLPLKVFLNSFEFTTQKISPLLCRHCTKSFDASIVLSIWKPRSHRGRCNTIFWFVFFLFFIIFTFNQSCNLFCLLLCYETLIFRQNLNTERHLWFNMRVFDLYLWPSPFLQIPPCSCSVIPPHVVGYVKPCNSI